jgi:hypothetical protein
MALPETLPLRARRCCFLEPLWTRAGSIVHYHITHYAGASVEYSTQCYARAAEGGAGEEERRRDDGTGKGGAAGGRAAGALVI